MEASMREISVIKTVQVTSIGKYGGEIMAAVKAVAGDDYIQQIVEVFDDDTWYRIGRKSTRGFQEIAIAVGDELETVINPEDFYDPIRVFFYNWSDDIPDGVCEEEIVTSVSDFRDALQKELAKVANS
jgi:hypothetical protein